jgi:hypothetical protein
MLQLVLARPGGERSSVLFSLVSSRLVSSPHELSYPSFDPQIHEGVVFVHFFVRRCVVLFRCGVHVL